MSTRNAPVNQSPRLRALLAAARDLGALYLALAAIPLLPALAASWLGMPWQALCLGAAWAVCWYAWLLARVRSADGDQPH